jgi:spermidine synthase
VRWPLLLAFLSGVPALVYEVVWTRRIGLLVGGQVEAISAVLVAFFGGLALGAWWLGGRADASPSPLRLYGALEAGAGLLALASLGAIGALDLGGVAGIGGLALAAASVLPACFLLGGTLPALLRSSDAPLDESARVAGWLVAANTAGSVLGVGAAALGAPIVGLSATFGAAAVGGGAIGALAWVAGGPDGRARPRSPSDTSARRPPLLLLGAAGLAGAATLAYEVLATRAAALRLGSSLLAWALVLALFLAALALGNGLAARRAARSARPAADLGGIECAAAALLVLGLAWLLPDLTQPAAGLSARSVLAVGLAVTPPVLLMGVAFPFFVRLGLAASEAPGGSFGALSAANTAGGLAGSLIGPFALLPLLGLSGGLAVCAGANALLGLAFLLGGAEAGAPPRRRRVAVALAALGLASWPLSQRDRTTPERGRLLFASHGRQATAAVVRVGGRRDLYVDGDAEASTAGGARATEELLAVLPLWLHPEPRRFLEVGLGSGITLGTAARSGLESLECVEIASSVLRAAPYFAPENHGIGAPGADPRVRLTVGDGRAWLRRHPGRYDIVVGNTAHPWSVGATGLYSREYFERLSRALAPGGVAVQWLPVAIDATNFAAIARTFFAVFPEGGAWWGADDLILVGARESLALPEPGRFEALRSAAPEVLARLAARGPNDLEERRIADADAVREALGEGELLTDDRPRLELRAARGRAGPPPLGAWEVVERMAAAGARHRGGDDARLLFVQSRAARARGEAQRADGLEALAERAGSGLARRARLARQEAAAGERLEAGELGQAEAGFRAVLGEDPAQPEARFGLAVTLYRRGDRDAALAWLEPLLASGAAHAEAWNLLGALLAARGDRDGARRAFARAIEADPFYPEARANAARVAAEGRPPTSEP